jgi:hypothetical protein
MNGTASVPSHASQAREAADEREWPSSLPRGFTSTEKDDGTRWIGGWLDPITILYVLKMIIYLPPLPETEPKPNH